MTRRVKSAKIDREHIQPGVYVIQADEDGPVKIGVSSNPERRLAQLQTGNPARLVLVAVFLCTTWLIARTLEAAVHLALAPFRLAGEWFRVSPTKACSTIEEQAARLGYAKDVVRRPRKRNPRRRDDRRRAA